MQIIIVCSSTWDCSKHCIEAAPSLARPGPPWPLAAGLQTAGVFNISGSQDLLHLFHVLGITSDPAELQTQLVVALQFAWAWQPSQ